MAGVQTTSRKLDFDEQQLREDRTELLGALVSKQLLCEKLEEALKISASELERAQSCAEQDKSDFRERLASLTKQHEEETAALAQSYSKSMEEANERSEDALKISSDQHEQVASLPDRHNAILDSASISESHAKISKSGL